MWGKRAQCREVKRAVAAHLHQLTVNAVKWSAVTEENPALNRCPWTQPHSAALHVIISLMEQKYILKQQQLFQLNSSLMADYPGFQPVKDARRLFAQASASLRFLMNPLWGNSQKICWMCVFGVRVFACADSPFGFQETPSWSVCEHTPQSPSYKNNQSIKNQSNQSWVHISELMLACFSLTHFSQSVSLFHPVPQTCELFFNETMVTRLHTHTHVRLCSYLCDDTVWCNEFPRTSPWTSPASNSLCEGAAGREDQPRSPHSRGFKFKPVLTKTHTYTLP